MTPHDPHHQHDDGDGDGDERLGAALRRLDVPGHRPGFWEALDARLDEADDDTGSDADRAPRSRPSGARRRARPRRAPRPRRRARGPLVLTAAAAVLALVVTAAVVVGVGEPGGRSPLAPAPATAAEVTGRMLDALADLATLQAAVVELDATDPSAAPVERRWDLALTAEGDLRATGAELDLSYDADAGLVRSRTTVGDLVLVSEETGVAPGPPDRARLGPVRGDLGAAVRALAAAEDPRLEEVEVDGRPAWRLVAEVAPDRIGLPVDQIEVVVDRATWLPVEVAEHVDGRLARRLRLEDVRLDEAVPASTFRLPLPDDVEVGRVERGFRRVALADVDAVVGRVPLVPDALPDGFRLAEVAVAPEAQATGVEGLNPPSVDVVSLVYRRAFEEVVVTTRRAGDDPAAWTDPFAVEGRPVAGEEVVLDGGALAGATAEVVVEPASLPHLWAVADGLVLTVAGDLAADDLVAVAASLRPFPGP